MFEAAAAYGLINTLFWAGVRLCLVTATGFFVSGLTA